MAQRHNRTGVHRGGGDGDSLRRAPFVAGEGKTVQRQAEGGARVAADGDRDGAGRRRGQDDRVAGALPLQQGQRARRHHHVSQRTARERERFVARQVLDRFGPAPRWHRVVERGHIGRTQGGRERERHRRPAYGDAGDRRGRTAAHGQRKGTGGRCRDFVERLAPVQRHGVPVHAGAHQRRPHAVHFVTAEGRQRWIAVEHLANRDVKVSRASAIRACREAHAVGIPVVFLNSVTKTFYLGVVRAVVFTFLVNISTEFSRAGAIADKHPYFMTRWMDDHDTVVCQKRDFNPVINGIEAV